MAAFIRALDRGMEAVDEDPGIVGEIVPTYTQIPPEVASALQPINFAVENRPEDIQQVADLMLEYGILDAPVDVEELLVPTSD